MKKHDKNRDPPSPNPDPLVDEGRSDLVRINAFALSLLQNECLEDLLWSIAGNVGRLCGFPDCVLYLREGDTLFQRAAFGIKNPASREIKNPIRLRLGQGIVGTAAGDRRPQRVNDVRQDPRYIFDEYAGSSELAVPIVFEDAVLGVIDSEAEEVGFYSQADEALLVTFANMAAPRIASALADLERRRAEDDLRHSRRRYERLVNSIDGIVWEAVPDSGVFSFVSRRAEALLGYPEADWLEQTDFWLEHMHPEDLPWAPEVSRRNFQKGLDRWELEYRMLAADGRAVWLHDLVTVAREAGEPARLLGIMVDVTERRRAEEDLRRAKEAAQAADRAKSDFLANMSHEIRTPMNGVVGMAEMLTRTGLDPRQQRYADMVLRSAGALLHVVDDILDFSKIEAGKLDVHMCPLDLWSLVDEVTQAMEIDAERRSLELRVRIAPGTPRHALGDRTRVRQVLTNLLGNALKFTAEGKVTLRLAPASDHQVQVEVTDTGPGIAEDKLEHIFEKFTQADTSPRRAHGGTGLGLAICRRLVELMGGTLGVRSRLGEGSVFWFTLPPAYGPADEPSGPEPIPPPPPGLRVLVVEDNEINQQVVLSLLESLGCRVEVADDGLAAVEQLRAASYDLVLMDCQMPRMDGYQATTEIRRLEGPRRHTPIVALTAHAMAGMRERCLEAGMDDYLTKPIDSRDLRCVLQRWTGPRPAAEPST